MNIQEAVKIFIQEQNYKGNINKKGSTAEQIFTKLSKIVSIFEQHGVNNPTEADFENILRPALAVKGKKAGEQAQKDTIKKGISLARRFYTWYYSEGENQMNDNEIKDKPTDEQKLNEQPDFYTASLNEAKSEQEAEAPKRGKPVTNGRSEKISLYLTPLTFNRLDDLRKYDETTLQDLLNEALEVYFKTRADDIRFLQEQEEARRARKARKSREAHND